MDSARESGRYEQMLAVLVAAEWIDLHSGPGFAGVVEYLRSQFDKVWLTLTNEQQEAAQAIFVKAMALERAFFDVAYKA